jgi:3-hydroxyisobutyrate dehydrogenase
VRVSGGSGGGSSRAALDRRLVCARVIGRNRTIVHSMRVAFLGTGAMGAPMARNLAAAGHDVRAWNRTRERAENLGAAVCSTPAEAAEGAEVLVTMLSDGPTTGATVDGILAPGLVWAQMATVGLDWTSRLAESAADAGAQFVDAPVIGSTPAAEAGELIVFASGPGDAIDRAEPVFSAVATETLRLGDADAASRLKLVFNFWTLGLVAHTGEVLALAEGLGVGGERFLELLAGGFADSAYAQMKGKKMLAEDWSPMFKLALGRKDLALAIDAASAAGVELTVAPAVIEAMDRAIERGYGEGDTAAVIQSTRSGSA